MEKNSELEEVGKNVRAILVADPRCHGINILLREYEEALSEPLPYRRLGFPNPLRLLHQLDGFVKVCQNRFGQGVEVFPVVNEDVSHIKNLVDEQKNSTRRRKPPRRPNTSNPSSFFQYGASAPKPLLRPQRSRPRVPYVPPVTYKNKEKCIERQINSPISTLNSSSRSDDSQPSNTLVPTKDQEKVSHETSLESDKKEKESNIENNFYINPKLKKRIVTLLQENPEGILCRKFTQKFQSKYQHPLEFAEYGFLSMREMAKALPDIFACEVVNGEIILFDATSYSTNRKDAGYHSVNENGNSDGDQNQVIKKLLSLNIASNPMSTVDSFSNMDSLIDPIEEENIGLVPLESFLTSDVMNQVWKSYFSDEVVNPLFTFSDFIIPESKELNVYVSTYYSPSHFWIQIAEQCESLDQLVHSLQVLYTSDNKSFALDYNIIVPGLAVVVLYKNYWNRGIIRRKISKDKITVLIVDYGDEIVTEIGCLAKLHKAFAYQPLFAIQCTLHGLNAVSRKYVKEVTANKFHELIQPDINGQFIAKITEIMIVNSVKRLKVILYGPTFGELNKLILNAASEKKKCIKDALLLDEDALTHIDKQTDQFISKQMIEFKAETKFLKAVILTTFFEGKLIFVLHENKVCIPLKEVLLFFSHVRNNDYIEQKLADPITKDCVCIVDHWYAMQEIQATLDERAARFFQPKKWNAAHTNILVPLPNALKFLENFSYIVPEVNGILDGLLKGITPDMF